MGQAAPGRGMPNRARGLAGQAGSGTGGLPLGGCDFERKNQRQQSSGVSNHQPIGEREAVYVKLKKRPSLA